MNMNDVVGRDDILFITFDTLRYDVAQRAWQSGRIPNLARLLPSEGWEQRHSPGSFTFAAHAAFFAGFLPTPIQPGLHSRLFALQFPGSETITSHTRVFNSDNIVSGLQQLGYHTVCVGGVGFFNKLSPLGNVFPAMFQESYWSPELGVTEPSSTTQQVRVACEAIDRLKSEQRLFLFINLSALHQPNKFYLPGSLEDNCATQQAALEYVDRELPPLFEALRKRGSGFGILCSDHGTAYGEDGYHGHRLAHPVVWNVPYAEIRWEREP
jgi:Sulfatase